MIAYLRLFFYAFCILTVPLLAAEESQPVKFQVLSEMSSVQPGKNFTVALQMELQPDWHAYWKNPGDAGAPPRVSWTLPEGFEVVDLQWPVPQRFNNGGLVTFGYKDDVVLVATLKAPASTDEKQPATIGADLQWVVCSDDTCLPGSSQGSLAIKVSPQIPQIDTATQPFFRKAREKLPQRPAAASASHRGGVLEFALNLPKGSSAAYTSADFFPENPDLIDHRSEVTLTPSAKDPAQYTIVMREINSTDPAKSPTLKGILVLSNADRADGWEIDVPVAANQGADETVSMADPQESIGVTQDGVVVPQEVSSYGVALVFALIGGMILNLMPCVLPVISIKILSFVQMAGQKRALIFRHGLVFALGVLASFWVLAGMLLGLQSYGASVGWGFQLQEPLFVGALACLLLVFAMSMFGVFEMGAGFASMAGQAHGKVKQEGYSASFFSGVLATAVATPCTGPFLGSAVGYAVTLNAWQAMSVFTFVGLGMALPYVFLSAFPQFLRWLPRPGKWMDTFKQMMGFLMLGAVLWLAWVFGGQTNSMALMMLLAGLFLASFACWIYGTWGNLLRKKQSRYAGRAAALIVAIAAATVIFMGSSLGSLERPEDSSVSSSLVADSWEPYSPERIAELQKQGIPVFVDFTAKWCLICQANHLVLSTQKVEADFKTKGVVRMKADWTKNDPRITEALRANGRNSVPLYLLYPGTEGRKPAILPQVLTPEVVAQHIGQLP